MDELNRYKKLGEPDKIEKSELWQAAIGLQDVDGLKVSEYLIETAKQNIEGQLSFEQVHDRLNAYYEARDQHSDEGRAKEADKVSARITEILSKRTFAFNSREYVNIHKHLFAGIFDDNIVGKMRSYDISKNEWVLNGETVIYVGANDIQDALDHDFAQERDFKYKGLDKEATVKHIVKFISNIWQAHPFMEGNTRTTAVFAIRYLRTFGLKVDNELFAKHSLYFRNALVRANYTDLENGIHATMEYLDRFFENLLFNRKHVLRNKDLLVAINR